MTPKQYVTKLLEDEPVASSYPDNLDEFTRAYLVCALWSSMDNSDPNTGGDPLDQNYGLEDLSSECVAKAIDDCKKFREENAKDLELANVEDSTAGHCTWLSRNGHGSGWFDEKTHRDPEVEQEACDRLQDACRAMGEVNLWVAVEGDNAEPGKIYCD